jgi:hypothetical protein
MPPEGSLIEISKKTLKIIVQLVLSFHRKYKPKIIVKIGGGVQKASFEKASKSRFQISFFKVFV